MQYSLELTAARFGLGLEELKTLLVKSRQKLYDARTQRPRPHLDSKMLASWNGEVCSFAWSSVTPLPNCNLLEDFCEGRAVYPLQ